mmetsp:Transcript_1940/g.4656  ORF Transcript_1940/g.4656 Transcript_1940/m.4656 type:complete len:206 (+) Transcript_1940:1074-1691(+)
MMVLIHLGGARSILVAGRWIQWLFGVGSRLLWLLLWLLILLLRRHHHDSFQPRGPVLNGFLILVIVVVVVRMGIRGGRRRRLGVVQNGAGRFPRGRQHGQFASRGGCRRPQGGGRPLATVRDGGFDRIRQRRRCGMQQMMGWWWWFHRRGGIAAVVMVAGRCRQNGDQGTDQTHPTVRLGKSGRRQSSSLRGIVARPGRQLLLLP